LYRNAVYTGITPQFWGSCDAICNRAHWQMGGTPNCVKGQPMQEAHVGHGVAPARFRNVQVRGAGEVTFMVGKQESEAILGRALARSKAARPKPCY
jgi:hypothetical protein